jgi:hypothetical protein
LRDAGYRYTHLPCGFSQGSLAKQSIYSGFETNGPNAGACDYRNPHGLKEAGA